MAIRQIVYYPSEILGSKARAIENIDGEVARLLDDMAETMYYASGIGLAAPQVNIAQRIITVDVSPPDERGQGLLQLINPRVVEGHGEVITEEGCLSFPGIAADVTRPAEVLVAAMDRNGREVQITAGGLLAVCLQHEIDHLEGITFVDHLSGLKRKLVLREYERAKRELEIEVRSKVPAARS